MEETMTIDQSTLAAILALLGGGLVTALTQALKKWLGIEGGWKAMALAALLSIGGTAYVLVSAGAFTVLALVIYSAVVFGTTTGLYKLSAKSSNA
jgi:hypothetical protein